jgi:hypothetical protein
VSGSTTAWLAFPIPPSLLEALSLGRGRLGGVQWPWQNAECSLCPQASLMANCQGPRRHWLASHMSTVFLTLLCFPSFLGAAVFLCYAIWQ